MKNIKTFNEFKLNEGITTDALIMQANEYLSNPKFVSAVETMFNKLKPRYQEKIRKYLQNKTFNLDLFKNKTKLFHRIRKLFQTTKDPNNVISEIEPQNEALGAGLIVLLIAVIFIGVITFIHGFVNIEYGGGIGEVIIGAILAIGSIIILSTVPVKPGVFTDENISDENKINVISNSEMDTIKILKKEDGKTYIIQEVDSEELDADNIILPIDDIIISQNPTNNTINITGPNSKFDVEIINKEGDMIFMKRFRSSPASISASDIPEGIYIIKISKDGKLLKSEKIVKNKFKIEIPKEKPTKDYHVTTHSLASDPMHTVAY